MSSIIVFLVCVLFNQRNRISSVSVVSGYRLDDWAIEVRSPAETKGFFM
jgi:hypothetical protein